MRKVTSSDHSDSGEEGSTAEPGSRIRTLWHQQRLTLDALSARAGVSRAMLSKIERGENNPTLVVDTVAQGLGITTSPLIDITHRFDNAGEGPCSYHYLVISSRLP